MINPFFKNKGPFKIEDLLKLSNVNNKENFKKTKVSDIKDLFSSTKKDITFFTQRNMKYLPLKLMQSSA